MYKINFKKENELERNRLERISMKYKKSNFWYKEPLIDKNWRLISRILKPASELEYKWNSVWEMFEYANKTEELQLEAYRKPYYYWEVDHETWKKIKSFFLIWDIHIWEEGFEWITTSKLKQSEIWNYYIDEDETYIPEVNALKILKEKFNISKIWLENEESFSNPRSLIWINAKKNNIKFIWLEDVKKSNDELENRINIFVVPMKELEILWVNLDTNIISTDKYNEILKDKKIQHYIESDNESLKLYSKETLTKISQIMIFNFYNDLAEPKDKTLKQYINYIKNSYNNLSIDEIHKLVGNIYEKYKFINSDENIIINRNNIWTDKIVNYIADSFFEKKWNQNTWIIVYWKAHIDNLMEQLIKKYDWKVNIYPAK